MKKLLILFIAVTSIYGYGCNREKNKLPDLPRGFSVEVDGAKWMGTSSKAKAGHTQSCSICPKDSALMITAQDTFKNINMYISLYKWSGNVGNYNYPNAGSTSLLRIGYYLNDTSTHNIQYLGVLGSLNITKLSSDNVQGTFWAKMVIDGFGDDTVVCTNGTFNLSLE